MKTPAFQRYIVKCHCKTISSALLVGNPAVEPAIGPMPIGVVYYSRRGSLMVACRACGRGLFAKLVRGKYSAQHQCSAKCMSSHGTVCECSCAGKNHGASHA